MRGPNFYNAYYSNPYWTPAVRLLFMTNLAVFAVQFLAMMSSEHLARSIEYYFALSPQAVIENFWVWQLVTSAFLHDLGDVIPWHLLFNLLILYFFGFMVERHYGTRRFIAFYLLCAIFAALVYTIFHFIRDTRTLCLGASGALMGVMVIAACLNPRQIVYFQLLFPIQMRTLIGILIGLDILIIVRAPNGGIAASAHLGGALFGYLYFRYSSRVYKYFEKMEAKWIAEFERKQKQQHKNIRAEVDRLLDKISEKGITALTPKEKEFLQQASKKYQRDI